MGRLRLLLTLGLGSLTALMGCGSDNPGGAALDSEGGVTSPAMTVA